MGFSVMLWGAKKLVPVEYWCPYGTLVNRSITLKLMLHRMQTLLCSSNLECTSAETAFKLNLVHFWANFWEIFPRIPEQLLEDLKRFLKISEREPYGPFACCLFVLFLYVLLWVFFVCTLFLQNVDPYEQMKGFFQWKINPCLRIFFDTITHVQGTISPPPPPLNIHVWGYNVLSPKGKYLCYWMYTCIYDFLFFSRWHFNDKTKN